MQGRAATNRSAISAEHYHPLPAHCRKPLLFVAANDVQGSDSHGFGYDEHNQLVSYTDGATTAGYGYDPQGRRLLSAYP